MRDLLRMPRLYCAASGRLLARYHSQLRPMLIRLATKYRTSHSRTRTVLRLKPGAPTTVVAGDPKLWFKGTPQPAGPKDLWPWPELQSTSLRSKCVPSRIDPGVVAEPVSQPFGLQRNRSWPIRKFWPTVLPRNVLSLPSYLWKPPTARRRYGPTVH